MTHVRIEHRGAAPSVHPTAVVAPTAVLSGDVEVGPHVRILAGAVVTSQGAPVRIGANTVVMENAVVRGAGRHPCVLGGDVLVGPLAHVSGATVGDASFVATGAALFNGCVLGEGSLVAVHGIVHIGTALPAGFVVPMGHIAVGDPVEVFSPADAHLALRKVGAAGFTTLVFGFDSSDASNADATRELCRRYVRGLEAHRGDRVLDEHPPPGDGVP